MWLAGIKEKVRVHKGDKEVVQRPVGESAMRSWDCSQIENEAEDESWREGDQMEVHWDEQPKTGGDPGTKKDGRKPFAAGGQCKKVRELVVQGWSIEEMKEKTKCCCGGRH